MGEADFWEHLEYRLCQELDGLKDKARALRRYWCDGVIPDRYYPDDETPRILGRAWMGIGGTTGQEEWQFTLLLDRPYDAPDQIDWSVLLPSPDVTKWLSVDPVRKRLVIDPLAAVPDG